MKHGCLNNKTFIITFPELREDLKRHFIRGYFDGDGSISDINPKKYKSDERYINKYFCFNIISNKNFIEQLKNILNNLNIKCTIQIFKNYDILCSYDISSTQNLKNYMYKNSKIYLKRKKDIFDLIKKN